MRCRPASRPIRHLTGSKAYYPARTVVLTCDPYADRFRLVYLTWTTIARFRRDIPERSARPFRDLLPFAPSPCGSDVANRTN